MVLITCAMVSKPTTSAVRKVADLARPSFEPVKSSTKSKPKPYFCASAITARIENTPTRLAIKFGVSFARTTPLPKEVVAKVSSLSKVLASVCAVGINSTKCIYRGGLKKCTPQKRFFSSSEKPLANSLIDKPEVFDAKIACDAKCGDTLAYKSCFQSMRSAIASMTKSHSANFAKSVS